MAAKNEAIGISILVVVLCVSPIIIVLVRNAAATIQVGVQNDVTRNVSKSVTNRDHLLLRGITF